MPIPAKVHNAQLAFSIEILRKMVNAYAKVICLM